MEGFVVVEGGGYDLTIANVKTTPPRTKEEARSYVRKVVEWVLSNYYGSGREMLAKMWLEEPSDLFHYWGSAYEIRPVTYNEASAAVGNT